MSLYRANANYDLWATDTKVESKQKKKRPQYVSSLVTPVQVPHEGASYNPPVDSYVEYANKVAKVEAKHLADEKRVMIAMKMASSSKLETENFKEEFHVFSDALHTKNELDDDFFKKEEIVEECCPEDETPCSEVKKKQPKPKSLKKKRDTQIRRLISGLNGTDKAQNKIRQQLNNLKSLTKTVRKESLEHEADISKRRKVRAIRKLTGKRRLGRGKFESFVDPVLLPKEFVGNLRSVHQHSNLLKERLNSLQRRNILPTPGDAQRALKLSLRARIVEKRSVKAITADTPVI